MQELQSEKFLLQNEARTIIIKQRSFTLLQSEKRNYKMGQWIYYKVKREIIKWDSEFITKWGNHYYNEDMY